MSDPVQLALLASIAPTITAAAGLIVGILNREKVKEIHTLTNSNLHKVVAELAEAKLKIGALEAIIELEKKKNV